MSKQKKMTLSKKHNLTGWVFLFPGAFLIFMMSFVPMIQALLLSFKTGVGAAMKSCGITNYVRGCGICAIH